MHRIHLTGAILVGLLGACSERRQCAELTDADLDAGKRPAIGDSVLLQDLAAVRPTRRSWGKTSRASGGCGRTVRPAAQAAGCCVLKHETRKSRKPASLPN